MSKPSAAVKNRWNAKAYDRIGLVVPKGDAERIKAAASNAGLSLNRYIREAIEARMQEEDQA